MEPKPRSSKPALILFFLAPLIGELLSGSEPPAGFFNPLSLVVLSLLYGGGAVLIRELRVRWGKGWATVFMLGAAYGVLEEGLMAKSFFDPHWMDLGLLGSYGRWAGVNWVWSLELTIYHAVFSIAIPILLVELIYPARRHEQWITRRGMTILSLLLLADVLLAFFGLTLYRPPLSLSLLAVTLTIGLFLLAKRLPARWSEPRSGHVPRPFRFALLGFASSVTFYAILWGLPEMAPPVLLTMLVSVAQVALVAWGVLRLSRGGAWNDEHRLALASGALMLFVLLAPIQEFDATRTDNTAGMTAVGIVTLLFLIWLWRRVHKRVREQLQRGS